MKSIPIVIVTTEGENRSFASYPVPLNADTKRAGVRLASFTFYYYSISSKAALVPLTPISDKAVEEVKKESLCFDKAVIQAMNMNELNYFYN